jgi:hypothetical protein
MIINLPSIEKDWSSGIHNRCQSAFLDIFEKRKAGIRPLPIKLICFWKWSRVFKEKWPSPESTSVLHPIRSPKPSAIWKIMTVLKSPRTSSKTRAFSETRFRETIRSILCIFGRIQLTINGPLRQTNRSIQASLRSCESNSGNLPAKHNLFS